MSYSEFPHTNYADYDEKQLIKLYRELVEKYEGTLETATQAKSSVDELKAQYQQFVSQVQTKIDTYTATIDERVSKGIQDGLSTIRSEFNIFKETLNSQLDTFTKDLNKNFDSLSEKVDNQNSRITSLQMAYKQMLDTWVVNMESKITEAMAENLAEMNSLLKSEVADLQSQIDEIKNADNSSIEWLRQHWLYVCGMSAEEFSNFGCLTCDLWNSTNISADEWYMNGKAYFGFGERTMLMYSPFTGLPTSVITVVYEMTNYLKLGALRAEQYDKMKIRAGEEPSNMMFNYDWKGDIAYE